MEIKKRTIEEFKNGEYVIFFSLEHCGVTNHNRLVEILAKTNYFKDDDPWLNDFIEFPVKYSGYWFYFENGDLIRNSNMDIIFESKIIYPDTYSVFIPGFDEKVIEYVELSENDMTPFALTNKQIKERYYSGIDSIEKKDIEIIDEIHSKKSISYPVINFSDKEIQIATIDSKESITNEKFSIKIEDSSAETKQFSFHCVYYENNGDAYSKGLDVVAGNIVEATGKYPFMVYNKNIKD